MLTIVPLMELRATIIRGNGMPMRRQCMIPVSL